MIKQRHYTKFDVCFLFLLKEVSTVFILFLNERYTKGKSTVSVENGCLQCSDYTLNPANYSRILERHEVGLRVPEDRLLRLEAGHGPVRVRSAQSHAHEPGLLPRRPEVRHSVHGPPRAGLPLLDRPTGAGPGRVFAALQRAAARHPTAPEHGVRATNGRRTRSGQVRGALLRKRAFRRKRQFPHVRHDAGRQARQRALAPLRENHRQKRELAPTAFGSVPRLCSQVQSGCYARDRGFKQSDVGVD